MKLPMGIQNHNKKVPMGLLNQDLKVPMGIPNRDLKVPMGMQISLKLRIKRNKLIHKMIFKLERTKSLQNKQKISMIGIKKVKKRRERLQPKNQIFFTFSLNAVRLELKCDCGELFNVLVLV